MILEKAGSGPSLLCPNQLTPVHPAHAFHTNLVNAAYFASDINIENAEFTDPAVEKVYDAIAHKQFDGTMHVYTDSVNVFSGGRVILIETYYFRCSTCGLILPANKVTDVNS